MYKEADAKVRAEPKPAAVQARPEISYVVSMSRPTTHLLEVEMRVRWQQMPAQLDLKMPVWTPGSYLIREYARHVQDFASVAGTGGELNWEKINKNTWRIQTGGQREVVARYKVYSNELTVRTNELNDEHAFWNNTALLLYPDGQLAAPSTVTVRPYGNWKVATGLRQVAGSTNTFTAPNFDILYDSPFEVSDFKEHTFVAAGKPHRLVITGEGNYDMKQIGIDTAKIAEAAVGIFGDMPTDDYLIILNLRGRGGLGHLNSTALQWNRFGFRPRSQYIAFLNLVAHEYFHLWNVKRIRPDTLGPFDYENENYTKLLWVAEGTTSYYESVLLHRAELITDDEFLESKSSVIQALQHRPGRFETSLEESSMDAWIKYYRQDANAINNQISYYDKGDIVSMMLDIVIREGSGGQRSLDDVMRYLYDEFYKKNRNFSPADFQQAAEKMAGRGLDDFFRQYVSGRAEIDYNSILSAVGLRLVVTQRNLKQAYHGADLIEEGGRLNVRVLTAGTPAYEQGLIVGDQILAIDGHRASQSFLQQYLSGKQPNDVVKLTIFRRDELREIDLRLGANTRAEYSIQSVESPTDAQRRAYKLYLSGDL